MVLLEIVTGVMPVTRGQTTQPAVPDDCPEVSCPRQLPYTYVFIPQA